MSCVFANKSCSHHSPTPPDPVQQYLKSDISVNLESNAVTVSGQNLSHVLDVLQGIAYVRPQQGISPDYTSHVAQARVLNLSTLYRCSDSEFVNIPHSEIQLNVFPETKSPTHLVEMAQILDKDSITGSVWIPSDASTFDRPPISQTIMEQKASAKATKQESSSTPPALIIQGSDIIITEPPIVNPGIRIFSDIQFLLPEETLYNNLRSPADHSAASSVLLDGCQVWISSSGHPTDLATEPGLRESEEERIEWPVEQVLGLGLFGVNDKHGVQLTGRRTSWDYASLLRTFHYWPPKSVRSFDKVQTNNNPEADVKYMATVGLMCTMESGQSTTSQFLVKIIIESPDNAERDLSSNDAIQRLSPEPHSPNMAKSDQERRPLSDKSLRPIPKASLLQETPKPSTNRCPRISCLGIPLAARFRHRLSQPVGESSSRSQAVVAFIVITVIVIMLAICLIIAVYVRRQPHPRTSQQPGRHRRFPLKPADFGGSSLKHDPTLRLTANPIGEMECVGIGTVREDLYGSYKQLASSHPYIFSPPTYRKTDTKSNSSGSARLADLEEFDDDDDEEDLDGGEDELFNSNPDCSKSELELSGADKEAGCSADQTQVLGADVHEWIDEDGHEEDHRINGTTTETKQTPVKRDLVSQCKTSKSGPPAVNV
ncbi:uncharacterized protein DEA37_0004849 [Paragonimus westermani]|uniref:Uncharacterized protein n=1 Tax=Paragonimus westermani TaxID=34504 RepID=A0A5J4NXQ3_9TREM|nr:uncharacterized protein DEA37_0004849 [Paragonimus westermani]